MSYIINPYRFAADAPSGGNYPDITPDSSTVVTDGLYKYVIFNATETFEVDATGDSSGSDEITYLVIAGGGSGGYSGWTGGGGGAGGYRTGTETLVSTGSATVTVGAGGAAATGSPYTGNNGDDSQIELPDFTQIDATGGGMGGSNPPPGSSVAGGDGGSGGGASADNPSATPGTGNYGSYDPVEGYDGGNCLADYRAGGGGGASEAGDDGSSNGGDGGDGSSSSITGSSVTRGGGGGGGAYIGTRGLGGAGGGGNGGQYSGSDPTAGTANTGGGGGGGDASAPTPGGMPKNGGSGVIIIRWKYQN